MAAQPDERDLAQKIADLKRQEEAARKNGDFIKAANAQSERLALEQEMQKMGHAESSSQTTLPTSSETPQAVPAAPPDVEKSSQRYSKGVVDAATARLQEIKDRGSPAPMAQDVQSVADATRRIEEFHKVEDRNAGVLSEEEQARRVLEEAQKTTQAESPNARLQKTAQQGPQRLPGESDEQLNARLRIEEARLAGSVLAETGSVIRPSTKPQRPGVPQAAPQSQSISPTPRPLSPTPSSQKPVQPNMASFTPVKLRLPPRPPTPTPRPGFVRRTAKSAGVLGTLATFGIAGGAIGGQFIRSPFDRKYDTRLAPQLKSLTQGAYDWLMLLRNPEYRELYGVGSEAEFLLWRQEHPEVPADAWQDREAYIEYFSYFPQGAKNAYELLRQASEEKHEEAEYAKQQREAEHRQKMAHAIYLHHFFEALDPNKNLATHIDKDKDFIKIVKEVREQNGKVPENIPTVVVTGHGPHDYVLNPELLDYIPDIREQADKRFRQEHKRWAKKYEKAKRNTFVNLAVGDHALGTIYANVHNVAQSVFDTQQHEYQVGARAKAPDYDAITQQTLQTALSTYAFDHEDRAKALSTFDENIRQIFESDEYKALHELDTKIRARREVLDEIERNSGALTEKRKAQNLMQAQTEVILSYSQAFPQRAEMLAQGYTIYGSQVTEKAKSVGIKNVLWQAKTEEKALQTIETRERAASATLTPEEREHRVQEALREHVVESLADHPELATLFTTFIQGTTSEAKALAAALAGHEAEIAQRAELKRQQEAAQKTQQPQAEPPKAPEEVDLEEQRRRRKVRFWQSSHAPQGLYRPTPQGAQFRPVPSEKKRRRRFLPGFRRGGGTTVPVPKGVSPQGLVANAILAQTRIAALIIVGIVLFFIVQESLDFGETKANIIVDAPNQCQNPDDSGNCPSSVSSPTNTPTPEVKGAATVRGKEEYIDPQRGVLPAGPQREGGGGRPLIPVRLHVNPPRGGAEYLIVHFPIPVNAEFVRVEGGTGNIVTPPLYGSGEVTWTIYPGSSTSSSTTSSSNTSSGTPVTIDVAKYTKSPYFLPNPTGPSDKIFTQDAMNNLNTLGFLVNKYQSYLRSKTKGAAYVDPFLSVIWNGAIEGINGNPYFWNCQTHSYSINQNCPGYHSGGWQVGYGMQVSQAVPHLIEDFEVVYGAGSADSAEKAREVGQRIISDPHGRITSPSTFPAKSIRQIVSEAQAGSDDSRKLAALILLDQSVGAIALAREIAGDIAVRDNWAGTMTGWDPSYYGANLQNFSNRMKAIAEKYTGVGTTTSPLPTTPPTSTTPNTPGVVRPFGTIPDLTVYIVPKPGVRDDQVLSRASMEIIGGPEATNTTASTLPTTPGETTTGTSSSSTPSGDTTPNTNTCGGKYNLSTPGHVGKNFGDPTCELANSPRVPYSFNGKSWQVPQILLDELRRVDGANMGYWVGIVNCEAPGWNANDVTFFANGNPTPDSGGAWGLFQMGRALSGPLGSGPGLNGEYDRGDVHWRKQVSNAVNYNNTKLGPIGRRWRYWECASLVWGLW